MQTVIASFGEGDVLVPRVNTAGALDRVRHAGEALPPGHYRARVQKTLAFLLSGVRQLERGVVVPPAHPQPHRSAGPVTINVAGSLGALNLGQLLGDMTTQVTTLMESGETEVADAIRQLTEAVLSHPTVADHDKRTAAEILAFLAEQATLDPSRRKGAMVREAMARVAGIVSVVADLSTVWQMSGPLIAAWFAAH